MGSRGGALGRTQAAPAPGTHTRTEQRQHREWGGDAGRGVGVGSEHSQGGTPYSAPSPGAWDCPEQGTWGRSMLSGSQPDSSGAQQTAAPFNSCLLTVTVSWCRQKIWQREMRKTRESRYEHRLHMAIEDSVWDSSHGPFPGVPTSCAALPCVPPAEDDAGAQYSTFSELCG